MQACDGLMYIVQSDLWLRLHCTWFYLYLPNSWPTKMLDVLCMMFRLWSSALCFCICRVAHQLFSSLYISYRTVPNVPQNITSHVESPLSVEQAKSNEAVQFMV